MLCVKENQRLVNELRELRHNNINIIHGINGYIELEDWDGLKKYFYDILEKTRNVSDASLSSIEKILNPSLRDLLYSKFKNALDTGIDTKVMIDENIFIENSLISETDLCKVIGEFLDTSIEAASQAVSKKISIYILNSKKSVSIIIENTFKEKPNMPLKNVVVTEGEGRKSAKQPAGIILSKHPKILNNTFIQHQVFVQEIQILR
jgi:two-component system sensor histidine kinase AgrC